jgi:hypothetical protein
MVVVVVIMAHGIGHALFLAPCLGIAQWGQSAQSWLLTGVLGDTLTRLVGSIVWLLAVAGFVAAGAGLLGQQAWWRGLAVGAAGVSLLGLILFARGGDAQPLLSAGLMDVAILVALLWAQWPSADLVGA